MFTLLTPLRSLPTYVLAFLCLHVGASEQHPPDTADHPSVGWSEFRGTGGSGLANWSHKDFDPRNLSQAWSIQTEATGHGSIIAQGRAIFYAGYSASNQQPVIVKRTGSIASAKDPGNVAYRVIARNKETGEIEWSTTVWEDVTKNGRHKKGTYANATLAIRGDDLVGIVPESGIFCLSAATGKIRWFQQLNNLATGFYEAPSSRWSFSSSPIIADGTVILQCDTHSESAILAYSAIDGQLVWRTERNDVPTFSTPTYFITNGQAFIACNGYKEVAIYNAKTGSKVWSKRNSGDIPIPRPVYYQNHVLFSSAHKGRSLTCVQALAQGPNVEFKEAWDTQPTGSYIPTPIIFEGFIFVGHINGMMRTVAVASGKQYNVITFPTTMKKPSFTSSPIIINDYLLWCSEKGELLWMSLDKKDPNYHREALGDPILSTPCVANDKLFIRTVKGIICLHLP